MGRDVEQRSIDSGFVKGAGLLQAQPDDDSRRGGRRRVLAIMLRLGRFQLFFRAVQSEDRFP